MTQSFLSFLFAILAAAPTVGKRPSGPPVQPMSQEEMEARVRIDVSHTLQVRFDDVRLIETVERTWPDRQLGCATQKSASDPVPTPGFRIIAEVKAERLTYHTDRFGRVVRCPAPARPAKT